MKLHLPKLLRNAVLACMVSLTGISASSSGADVISVNFGSSNDHAIRPGDTEEINGSTGNRWNNIIGGTKEAVNGVHMLKSQLTDYAASLVLSTTADPWGPGDAGATLTSQLHSGYLDISNSGSGSQWTLDIDADYMVADLYLYLSGDGGQYNPILINGESYIGGTNQKGDAAWGDRGNSQRGTISDNNRIIVTGVSGTGLHVENVRSTANRSSLAGFQLVEGAVYKTSAPLAAGVTQADSLNWTLGSTTSTLSGIADGSRYLATAADSAGSTLNFATSTTLQGLQVTAGSMTLTADSGVELNIDLLMASKDATMNVETTLASGSDLTLGGRGTIIINESQALENLVISGNVQLADGVIIQLSGNFNVCDTALISAGAGAGIIGAVNEADVQKVTEGGVTFTANKSWREDFLVRDVALSADATAQVVFNGDGTITFSNSSTSDVTVTLSELTVGTTAGAQSIAAVEGTNVVGDFDGQLKLENNQVFTVGKGVSLSYKQAADNTGGRAIVLGHGTLNIDGGSITAESLCLADGGSSRKSNLSITNGGYLEITSTDNDNGKHGGICLSHWQYSTSNVLIEDGEFRALGAKVNVVNDATRVNLTIGSAGVMNTKGLRMHDAANVSVSGMLNLGTTGIENPSGTFTIDGGTLGALSAEGWSGAQDITLGDGSTVQLAVYDVNSKTYSGAADIALTGKTTMGGSIALAGGGTLTLSKLDLTSDTTLTGTPGLVIEGSQMLASSLTHTGGKTTLRDFRKLGFGSLTLGAVDIDAEEFSMNAAGGALTMSSVTFAADTTLVYDKAGTLAQLGALGSAVTLNLYGVMDDLATGVDLGFTKGDKTLDEIKAMLTVVDLTEFSLSEGSNGNVFLTSTSSIATDWDPNWGKTLASQPSAVTSWNPANGEFVEDKFQDLYDVDANRTGGSVYLKLTAGTEGEKVLLGGSDQVASDIQGDIWLVAEEGAYHTIVAGSRSMWANEASATITGDTHILIKGTATATNLVGGMYGERNAVLVGNSYISVMAGDVTGNIFGSSVNVHNGCVQHLGDSYVFVYTPLSGNGAIVGGAGRITNQYGDAYLNGNTHVIYDLSSYSGEAVTVQKNIIGGHYYDCGNGTGNSTSYGAGYQRTITGVSNVTIKANDLVTYSGKVVGGSYIANGNNNNVGSISVELDGGVYTADVIAGSYLGAGVTSTNGATTLKIKDGEFRSTVYGGTYVETGTATVATSSADITIEGGSLGNLIGGHFIGGGASNATAAEAVEASIGDISITVSGGEVGTLIGGTRSWRRNADSTISQGDIAIELTGGTVGDVYAAGSQKTETMLSTASTSVTIGKDVTITSGKTISGGYEFGSGKSGSTITGNSTLQFIGTNASAGNLLFKDFNIIDVNDTATLGALQSAGFTKKGTGNLTIKSHNNNNIASATVAAGSLTLNGNYSIAGGVQVQSGASLLTGGATTLGGALTMADGAALNVSAGALTLAGDSGAALSLTNVALTTGTLGETSTLISGISTLAGYTSGEVDASTFFSSINNIANLSSYKVKVENGSLILLKSSAPLYWEGGDGNWSSNGWAETDGATADRAFETDADAIFSGTDSAITVDSAVTVGAMTVSGAAYTFNGSNAITADSLEIAEDASATFGAGTLALDSLNTLTVDGTLDLTAMDGKTVFLNTVDKAAGDGTIKLSSSGQWVFDNGGSESAPNHLSVDVNYEFSSGVTMNFGGYKYGVLDIRGGMDIAGVFLLENRITADVMGGSLKATEIKLGHSSAGYSGHLKMSSGSITAGSITVSNAATTTNSFTMSDGTLELTGTDGIATSVNVGITGGTLKAGANSWGITGTMTDGASNASIGGATIETGEGTITIENANLTSALTNKGNLTLAGTINIVDTTDSAWAPTPVAGSAVFKDGAGVVNAAGNGFCYSTLNYTIIGTGSTGETTVNGVTWQLNGEALATGSGYADGVLTVVGAQAEADRGVFYVNSGTVNYGGTGGADMTGASSIRLSGGELVLNQAPTIGMTVDAASSLTIAAGVTLSHGSLSGQNNTNKVTMKGAGATAVYAMGSVMNATGLDFTSSDYWKGTVTLDDVTTINTRYLDNLGNAGSVISINGLSGWLERSAGVMAHIILREKGLTMTDNSGDGSDYGKNFIYKGGVSGKGDFTLATTSTNAPVFEFAGDMAKWEGGFVVNQAEGSTAAPNVTVRFNGGGNLFAETEAKGVVLNRKGTLNLTVGNTTSATTMRAGITNTAEGTININTVGTTSLNGVLSNTGTGAINLTNSGTLSLVNDTTLSRLSNSSFITASGKTLTVTGGISGIETSGVTTCGSITAGALTLQGAANNVEALTLTGALTLGTADVASKLTAGTLDVGSITVNKLADGLMDVTEIASSSLTLNIDAQVLLTHFSQADTKSLVLLTADTLTTEPTLTLNITNKDTDDNRYTYTLAWDGQNMVLSSDPNGQKWVGTAGNNIWSTDGSWDGGAPQATDSVVFAGAGCSDVILDGQLAVEDVIIHVESGSTTDGYVFNAKTDDSGATLPSSLDISKNLSVNNGSLDVGDNVDITVTEHTDVLENGELNILAGGSVSALSGISNAGTVTIAAAPASGGNAGALSVQNGGSVQNSGTLEVNGSLLAGEGLQHNASGSDIINSGTITNTGSIIADGNLTNSGVLAQNSGSIKVYGDASNTGADIATPDSGEKPAGMTIAGGTVDILGDLANSGSINQTGGSIAVGGVLSNSGSITVTGEGSSVTLGAENTAATTDSLENTGSLTVDDGAAVTVNGSLDNNGGTIIIGTAAIADGDPGTEGDQPVAATTGTLEVTGNLIGTGGAGKLVVNESSELTVGGDLEAADVVLAFGGNVTVGGKATVKDLTIADTATFTADAAKITGTLLNNGEITVGSYDDQGNLVGDADTVLDINKLTGSGKVTVAEGGTLKIATATNFTGELENLGSITVEQGVTISTSMDKGGDITAPSLTIGGLMKDVVDADGEVVIDPDTQQPVQEYVSANGTVLGDVATESIIIDTLDHTAGPHLTLGSLTGKLSATDTDNKVQIKLTELGSSEGVDKLIANGEKDYHLLSIGGTVSLDDLALVDNLSDADEQKLWKSGLKLGDLTGSSTMALRAASTNVSISVSNQSLEEATWDTAGETTKIGLDLGTLTNGTMVLLENDMLDKVQSVNVTSDVTLDLVNTPNALDSQVTAPVAVNINGLQGGKKLTIKGNGDTVNLTTLANKFSGTVELTGKVTANMGAAANTAMKGATIVAMGDTVTLNGTLTNGELVVSQDKTANGNLQLANSDVKVVIAADSATLDNEQLKAPIADLDSMSMKSGAEGTVSIGTYDANGNFVESLAYNKYYTNIRMEGSKVLGDRNTSYYSDKLAASASSANGKAGLELADGALVNLNAQTDQDSTLGDVLDTLDAMIATGDKEGVDELGAALAGASTAVLGMAVSGDVERQLQAIRNRTTTMGVDQGVVNPEMPYFNAWINAESDNSELSDNVTEGGYKLNSWGGTVGFDVDFTPTLTAGLALTAMYGDLTVSGADAAKGDLDTYYVSAFARYSASAWTHTFVATAGLADLSLDRTVMGEKVEGETDGLSFGLMYEVGRVFALNEDATACLQPILNVSWRHTELDGYSEKGGDLALDVDKQSYDTVTFGLGARLQAVVGESMYNRTSIFECRLLAKLDTGDTQGTSEVGLAGATAEVESAERGAFGLEAGAGLTIPLGEEGSSIFADASIELRSEYSNVNGTVGYRINF